MVSPALIPLPISKKPHFLPSSDTCSFLMADLVLLWTLNLYSGVLATLKVPLIRIRATASIKTFPKLLLTRIHFFSQVISVPDFSGSARTVEIRAFDREMIRDGGAVAQIVNLRMV